MNCTNCKNPIQENDSSCEWCGFEKVIDSKSLSNLTNNAQASISNYNNTGSKETSKFAKNKLYFFLSIAGLVIILLSIYIFTENSDNSNQNDVELYPDEATSEEVPALDEPTWEEAQAESDVPAQEASPEGPDAKAESSPYEEEYYEGYEEN